MRRVVKRLQALIVPHIDAAKKMDRLLGAADLKAVIAALVAETDGLSPNPHLDCPDEILRYLRETLYLELLAEPSNVFYTTAVNSDVVRYEPMPRTFWKDCLLDLRNKLHLDDPEPA